MANAPTLNRRSDSSVNTGLGEQMARTNLYNSGYRGNSDYSGFFQPSAR